MAGAKPWVQRAQQELRATGLSTGPNPATGNLADGLPPQQLEIAQLAASGLTNAFVGARR